MSYHDYPEGYFSSHSHTDSGHTHSIAPPERVYILAGNRQQAANFVALNNIPEATYLDSPDDCRGLYQPTILVTGSFWERDDVRDFIHVLNPARPKFDGLQLAATYEWFQRAEALSKHHEILPSGIIHKFKQRFKTVSS